MDSRHGQMYVTDAVGGSDLESVSGSAVWQGPLTRLLSVGRRAVSGVARHDRRQSELLRSLSDVADAVSSAVSVEDVLRTIVDRAKRVASTDKAILLLTQEGSDELDFGSLVVRGRRDQHEQEAWQSLIAEAAPTVFANGYITLSSIPETKAWVAYSPIRMQSRRIGLLCAINDRDRPFSRQQMEFLAILGAFAATAVENARLAEEARYVLLSSERERISREMHDGISQSLFSIALGLELARKQAEKDPAGVTQRLGDLQEQLSACMAELRRVIYDLRPLRLQEVGLLESVRVWTREATAGRGIAARVDATGEPHSLSPRAEACLYRVAKEAVSNAVRHAHPTRLMVSIDYADEAVVLTVTDDGIGFAPESVAERVLPGGGLGLRSMHERTAAEGGDLQLTSGPGKGTTVRAELPTRRER